MILNFPMTSSISAKPHSTLDTSLHVLLVVAMVPNELHVEMLLNLMKNTLKYVKRKRNTSAAFRET